MEKEILNGNKLIAIFDEGAYENESGRIFTKDGMYMARKWEDLLPSFIKLRF